jgi:hypothetical protein
MTAGVEARSNPLERQNEVTLPGFQRMNLVAKYKVVKSPK